VLRFWLMPVASVSLPITSSTPAPSTISTVMTTMVMSA
jgi:hypothetical protein